MSENGSTFEHLISLLTLIEPIIQSDINLRMDVTKNHKIEIAGEYRPIVRMSILH